MSREFLRNSPDLRGFYGFRTAQSSRFRANSLIISLIAGKRGQSRVRRCLAAPPILKALFLKEFYTLSYRAFRPQIRPFRRRSHINPHCRDEFETQIVADPASCLCAGIFHSGIFSLQRRDLARKRVNNSRDFVYVRISRHAEPPFHVMPGHYVTHAGPPA